MTGNKIAIVGAGAAGLFSAIFAGEFVDVDTQAVAFDGAKKLGAKIFIAGGGRCNVTHDVVRPDDYAVNPDAGTSRNAVKKVLKSFTVDDTIDFFRGRGVELKREDTGKLFPTTDRARTVLNALLEACYEAERQATDRAPRDRDPAQGTRRDDFLITTSQGDYTARRVILSTGGLALPKTGSDGFGYRLAKSLGHTVTETWPALVPLLLPDGPDGHWLKAAQGHRRGCRN